MSYYIFIETNNVDLLTNFHSPLCSTVQRFRNIRHIMAHTLMRHPDRVKQLNRRLQNLACTIRQAEHRRQLWEREAENLPPKRSRRTTDRD